MHRTPIDFAVRDASSSSERVIITVGGAEAGEATVHYEDAVAAISAHVNLTQEPPAAALRRMHHEFAEELLAFVLNRGTMAQEPYGAITYHFGADQQSLILPTHREVGLGYPNSW